MSSHNQATPWHYGIMSILALLLFGLAALEYVFLKLGIFSASVSEEQRAYLDALPNWINALWALAVWGGLLGAWLLFQRNRFSVLILFAAFVLASVVTAWLSFLHIPTLIGVFGLRVLLVHAVGCGIAFLIYVYARAQRSEHRL